MPDPQIPEPPDSDRHERRRSASVRVDAPQGDETEAHAEIPAADAAEQAAAVDDPVDPVPSRRPPEVSEADWIEQQIEEPDPDEDRGG